jgi:nucleoside-diphosphate-sugar epimerase
MGTRWRLPELGAARVLVTGATGLIGTNLVRRLTAVGPEVGAVVRPGTDAARLVGPRVSLLAADLRDPEATETAVRRFRPTHVVSTALPTGHARTAEQRRAAVEVGVLATVLLLDLAVETGVRSFVHVGGSLEYGPRDRPLREDDPLEPSTFRGAVKAAASLLCLQRGGADDLSVVVVRPFSVYGPWERNGRLVPTALRAALDGGAFALTAEDPVHDFVFVGDVVEGIVAALSAADELSGRALNLGTGIQTRNSELLRLVERATGRSVALAREHFPASPADTHHWSADTSAARDLLGWTATTDLPSGLAATARWLQESRGR